MPRLAGWNVTDCGNCLLEYGPELSAGSGPLTCPHCRRQVYVNVLPALFEGPAAGSAGEELFSASESACYYHPEKRAVVPCDACGRFLCALCDVEMNGRHLCASCITLEDEAPSKKGKRGKAKNEYTHFDSIALICAVLGIVPIFWFFAPAFTLAAFYFIVRYWNKPISAVPRSRWRFVVAGILALSSVALWAVLIVAIVGSNVG